MSVLNNLTSGRRNFSADYLDGGGSSFAFSGTQVAHDTDGDGQEVPDNGESTNADKNF
jgi:hypothetical protein